MAKGCLPTAVLPLRLVAFAFAFAFAFYALRCQTDAFCAAGCGAPYAALPDAISARLPQPLELPFAQPFALRKRSHSRILGTSEKLDQGMKKTRTLRRCVSCNVTP